MRLPTPLLDRIKQRITKTWIPYQRLMRDLMERGLDRAGLKALAIAQISVGVFYCLAIIDGLANISRFSKEEHLFRVFHGLY